MRKGWMDRGIGKYMGREIDGWTQERIGGMFKPLEMGWI